jgi:O-acetyl-ADP-ribose deacetylase (regulator of RNase III)
MPLDIIRGDIAKIQADAIVNTANTALQKSGGVCGAIFKAAGAGDLQRSCDKVGRCKIGSAVVTEGFKLSKYIIHTVGPAWQGGNSDERNILYACYRNSLALAKKCKCESVAFPLISSGANGYPNEKALRVAIKAIGDFLLENDMTVLLVLLKDTQFSLSGKLHKSIQEFINENYTDAQQSKISQLEFEALRETATSYKQPSSRQVSDAKTMFELSRKSAFSTDALKNIIDERANETFPKMLFRLIDERQERFPKDSDVYRRANITRGVFSDIRSRPNYNPSKNTVISLAVALELSLDLTLDLLMKAGFALSDSNTQDLIVKYFINEKEYDIHKINETLYQYGQNLLGASMK